MIFYFDIFIYIRRTSIICWTLNWVIWQIRKWQLYTDQSNALLSSQKLKWYTPRYGNVLKMASGQWCVVSHNDVNIVDVDQYDKLRYIVIFLPIMLQANLLLFKIIYLINLNNGIILIKINSCQFGLPRIGF